MLVVSVALPCEATAETVNLSSEQRCLNTNAHTLGLNKQFMPIPTFQGKQAARQQICQDKRGKKYIFGNLLIFLESS